MYSGYLGLSTSDDGQKCWRAGLCMTGVCFCVFLCRYLGLGTSDDGQKCWHTGLCMPGVCFCVSFCVGTWGEVPLVRYPGNEQS